MKNLKRTLLFLSPTLFIGVIAGPTLWWIEWGVMPWPAVWLIWCVLIMLPVGTGCILLIETPRGDK